MRPKTIDLLICPKIRGGAPCRGFLRVEARSPKGHGQIEDIETGELFCKDCQSVYPILSGVAVVVDEVEAYLHEHIKGISKRVEKGSVPRRFQGIYQEALRGFLEEQGEEHIEEDLESERVNALYLLTHFFGSELFERKGYTQIFKDPLLRDLISRYWDQGPMSRMSGWVPQGSRIVELGCGVGGLSRRFSEQNGVKAYLGVDQSFHSIHLARKLNLGGGGATMSVSLPGDLIHRPLSVSGAVPVHNLGEEFDFIVGDISAVPVRDGVFDGAVSLNTIDMLHEPQALPEEQARLVVPGGFAIQTGPYIWHEGVAEGLRSSLGAEIEGSSDAVRALYEQAGFKVEAEVDHVPWLFFKHVRQLEIYSVHMLFGRKGGA